jgi:hypothetical protein
MENRAQKKHSVFFSHLICYRHFFDFLSLGELAILACLNKEAHQTINLLFKDRLLKEGVFVDPSCTDYFKAYKEVHLKSVVLLQLGQLNPRDKLNAFSNAKISKKTLFTDKIVLSFSFGIKFVGYYLKNKELILITKVDYLEQPKQLLMRDMHRRSFQGIEKYNLEARQATMLDSEKTLRCLIYMKDKNIHTFEEVKLDLNVEDFECNYNYLAYRTQAGDIFLISKYSNLNLGQSCKYKISIGVDPCSLHLTGLNLYLRTLHDQKLWFVNLSSLDPIAVDGNTQLKVVSPQEFVLGDKPVAAIYPGLRNEVLILSRDHREFSKWSNEEVRGWFTSIGISGIDNILKYDKFLGKNLLDVDVTLMKDKLGIHNSDVHNKILSEIDLVKESNREEFEVYGQGYNLEGQLCINNGNKNVPCLTKMKIPELANNESIKQIIFGWSNTLILTTEDRMFLSFKRPQKKKIGFEDEDEPNSGNLPLPKLNSKKTSSHVSGGRKQSSHQPSPDQVEEPNSHQNAAKRKKSAKFIDVLPQHDSSNSLSSGSEDENGFKKHENKKPRRKNSSFKQNRAGTKKRENKQSSQQNKEDGDDEDWSQARWIEITNLFQTNKYIF